MRIVFDGDGVLFSRESENIFCKYGLEAFEAYEMSMAHVPMKPGPCYPLFKCLSWIQRAARRLGWPGPFQIYLVTARRPPADKRVIRTIEHWNGWVDGYYFMGGQPKAGVIRKLEANIFFDDKVENFEGLTKDTRRFLIR